LPVRLSGRIDRLEHGPEGTFKVVDFKTGSRPLTEQEAAADPQLGVYQIALDSGLVQGFEGSAGAALVYLATGGDKPKIVEQPPLEQSADPTWVAGLLQQCVADTASASFAARPGEQCSHCPVRASCPAQDQGKQVTA
jgi:RecB family exonuclease